MVTLMAPLLPTLCLALGGVQETPDPPRLIVLISVDQMIPEHLRRLEPWIEGGFRRFLDAEVWENAHHEHAISDTAPGHATLGTGVHPSRHGVIANSWLSPKTGRIAYCVGDPGARALGPEGVLENIGSSSPTNLLVPALGDYLKAANADSVTVAIAGKDRAAILSSGKDVDLALWWNRPIGGFISSSWYGERLPEWVAQWNEGWIPRSAEHLWEELLEGELEGSGTDADDRPGEPPGRKTFPHRAPRPGAGGDTAALGRWVFSSPLIDLYTLELAGQALERYSMGRDESVDYLFVGLSACDTLGHAYGPYSHEVTDVLLRADRGLETLFRQIDEQVGRDRWVAALSSDHGILELPEALRRKGLPAQRHSLATSGAAVATMGKSLAESFGEGILLGAGWRGLRFSHERMRVGELESEEVEDFAVDMLSEIDFIQRIFTRTELEGWSSSGLGEDPLLDLMARSYHPERSWDLVFAFKPWKVFQAHGTSHGSPWPYDRKVPLAFLGPGHQRGKSHTRVATTDVLPTLLSRAGLPVPSDIDGKILP